MRERATGLVWIVYTMMMLMLSLVTLMPANGQNTNGQSQITDNRKIKKLPSFSYNTLEGKKFTEKNLKDNSKLMIVYFNPLCEVCQREMKEIVSNMDYFGNNIQIVMISPNPKDEIETFAKNYKLHQYGQITLLHDENDVFYKEFNAIGYPSLYLYDEGRHLIEHFDSHADIAEIKDAFGPTTAKR